MGSIHHQTLAAPHRGQLGSFPGLIQICNRRLLILQVQITIQKEKKSKHMFASVIRTNSNKNKLLNGNFTL